jgi:hypothetical protein
LPLKAARHGRSVHLASQDKRGVDGCSSTRCVASLTWSPLRTIPNIHDNGVKAERIRIESYTSEPSVVCSEVSTNGTFEHKGSLGVLVAGLKLELVCCSFALGGAGSIDPFVVDVLERLSVT